MAIFNRSLSQDEAAIIVRRQGLSPLLIQGPASVRTFGRWKQMVFVDLKPLSVQFTASDVSTTDGGRISVQGSVDAQVVRPVDAATKVVDYRRATSQITETAVRASLRKRPSSDVVDRRPDLEHELLVAVRDILGEWGISVSAVRVRPSA